MVNEQAEVLTKKLTKSVLAIFKARAVSKLYYVKDSFIKDRKEGTGLF